MIDYIEDVEKVTDAKRVVLLQSGGLDSCCLACLLSQVNFEIHHLFIDYGQNAREQELKKSQEIIDTYGGTLHIVKIDLPWLADSTLLVKHDVGEYDVEHALGSVKAGTYVPMRNHIFISIAASLAESLNIRYIATAIDGNETYYGKPLSGAPDKHPTFVKAIEKSLTEGSARKHCYNSDFVIIAPLLGNTKEDTIEYGLEIGCDFSHSWSCYNSGEKPCGKCCACLDRKFHFANLGLEEIFK